MNAITLLQPYQHAGMWVFDDPDKGLTKEPFVAGIDEMINRMTAAIPDAAGGFRLLFSPTPFPGFTVQLQWRREEGGGNWYHCRELDMEGWLCPALFRYFTAAPAELYAKIEPRPQTAGAGSR